MQPLQKFAIITATMALLGVSAIGQVDLYKLKNYRLLKHPSGCQQEGPSCVPVIFIHGIHGSTQDGKECDLDAPASSDCYWSPLLNHLLPRFNPPASTLVAKIQPYIFRYLSDEDDTTMDIGRKLLRLVDCEGITVYPSGIQSLPCKAISDPLIIVAHSMGGIVARTFMLQHTSMSPEPGYKRILAAITLATPHHGTQVANLTWRNWQADKLDFGVHDILLGDYLNFLDQMIWGFSGSFHLSSNSNRPNRSDLVWDNYDGYFDAAKAALPNDSWELNPILSALAASDHARKLIVYGGVVEPNLLTAETLNVWNIHSQLPVAAAVMRNKLRILVGSDGVVPLDSALFNRNQHVVLRRGAFKGYDHTDMKGNPQGDNHAGLNGDLFTQVAADLEAVLNWRGVPPRIVGLNVSPDTITAGGTAVLTYQVKSAFDGPTRVLLKGSMKGRPPTCEVREIESGVSSPKLSIEIPTGTSESQITITAEILPEMAPCSSAISAYDITKSLVSVNVKPTALSVPNQIFRVVVPGGRLSANGFRHGEQVTGYYTGSPGSYVLSNILPRSAAPLAGNYCAVDLRHSGIDISASSGAAIYPIADGIVDKVVADYVSQPECEAAKKPTPLFCSLGYAVLVKHSKPSPGKSNTYSLYLHMKSKPEVTVRTPVTAGQSLLGRVGRTGATFGDSDHVHLEVRHFSGWFNPDWNNIYGVERAGCDRPTPGSKVFNSDHFETWWTDPLKFVLPADSSTLIIPTILLTTTRPVQKEYRIGENVQLRLSTTSAGQILTAPLVSTFLWRDGPDGRRFLVLDNRGLLSETPRVTPVSTPAPAIDFFTVLPPISILPSSLAGTYSWQAGLYSGEVFDLRNRIAASEAVEYRIVSERVQTPSVVSIGTRQTLYRDGDTMVIDYSTIRGTSTAAYDLMLRLTSKATGKHYYFYDDSEDSNRWIHAGARPMLTSIVTDGTFQIPSGTTPAILIDRSVPSGDYTVLAYFSEIGKNLPIGGMAQSSFHLETPTAEGGCFVATAAFGSPMFGAVESLRQFRDRFLMTGSMGRSVVLLYYHVGPAFAAVIAPRAWLRKIVRVALWPAVVFSAVALQFGLWFTTVLSLLIAVASGYLWIRAVPIARLLILAGLMATASFAGQLHGAVVRSKPFPAPIAGAKVEIENSSRVATSDQYGRFSFDRLAAGTFAVRAVAPGYLPGQAVVNVPTADATVSTVIAATPVGSRTYEYFLPHTAETDGWWTFFTLLNPNQTVTDLTMAAYDSLGSFLGTAAKISLLKIGQQMTGAPSQFFTAETIAKAAYYKITSSSPISGFEMFGHTNGTLAAFPLTTAESEEAYLPHVAEDSQWWTGVSFISGDIRTNDFHLEAMDRTGKLLFEAPGTVSLRPGEKTVGQLPNYFGWDFPLDISWVRVSSGGAITGFELFGTRDFKMLAAVPALSHGSRNFFFPHIATTKGWWTGIAMLNVDSRPGIAGLSAFAADGRVLGVSRPVTLAPLERTVDVVEHYFGSWPDGVAYLEVASETDIIGFELTGRFTPNLFGGLVSLPTLGTAIAFPYAVSNTTWDTELSIVNTSASATTVAIEAMSADGVKRAEARLPIAAKGFRSGNLRSLFGTVPSGMSWVRARSDGRAMLSGFLKLFRVATGEFTDIPAVQIVPAAQAGRQSSARVAGSLPSVQQSISPALATLAPQVTLDPIPGGGVRIGWPSGLDDEIETLTGGMIRRGDVILRVESIAVASRTDLWNAYLQFRSTSEVSILVRRRDGSRASVRLRNPWAALWQ